MNDYPNLSVLLDAHGLLGVDETPLEHSGFSGAELTRIVRDDGVSFVLKRMSIERDWIMRATDDAGCREAAFAALNVELGKDLRTPVIGVARDGDQHALLMRDITAYLLPQAMISERQLSLTIERMADLHRVAPPSAAFSWCDLVRRLTLLTPATARIAESYGAPVAEDIHDGWLLFELHGTARAVGLVHSLFADPSPLVRALGELPPAFLHGDLKLDNIGLDADGRIWLLDWAMTLVAPPAVELGWFLAINSRRIPSTLDDVMRRYADATDIPQAQRARHDALTVLCGLLLRGWRKALDAESGDPDELAWWCDRAEAAASYLDL